MGYWRILATQAQNVSQMVCSPASAGSIISIGRDIGVWARKLPPGQLLGPCLSVIMAGSRVVPNLESAFRQRDDVLLELLLQPSFDECSKRLLFLRYRLAQKLEPRSRSTGTFFDPLKFNTDEVTRWPAYCVFRVRKELCDRLRERIGEIAPDGCPGEFRKKYLLYSTWAVMRFLLTMGFSLRSFGNPYFGDEFVAFETACYAVWCSPVTEHTKSGFYADCEASASKSGALSAVRETWNALESLMNTSPVRRGRGECQPLLEGVDECSSGVDGDSLDVDGDDWTFVGLDLLDRPYSFGLGE